MTLLHKNTHTTGKEPPFTYDTISSSPSPTRRHPAAHLYMAHLFGLHRPLILHLLLITGLAQMMEPEPCSNYSAPPPPSIHPQHLPPPTHLTYSQYSSSAPWSFLEYLYKRGEEIGVETAAFKLLSSSILLRIRINWWALALAGCFSAE